MNEAFSRVLSRMMCHVVRTGSPVSCTFPADAGYSASLKMSKQDTPAGAVPHPRQNSNLVRVVLTHRVELWSPTTAASLQQRFQRAYDRYLTDNGIAESRTWWTLKPAAADETLRAVERALRRMCSLQLCECGEDLIHDDGAMCFPCSARLAAEDLSVHDCPICCCTQDRAGERTRCCKQWLHAYCLARSLRATSSCPFCRHPVSPEPA